MQITKCDRCGRMTEESIDFRFVNTAVTEAVETMFGLQKAFLSKTFELCYDCAGCVAHWLAHQENDLVRKT